MAAKEYLVQELEVETGINVRNIRYYTEQGLLPPPAYRGKYAYYSPDHLKRLKLIDNLRKRNFPLDEIRAILYQLDEAGLDKLLGAQDEYVLQTKAPHHIKESSMPASKDAQDAQDTVAFIDYLMGKRSAPVSTAPVNSDLRVPLLKTDSIGRLEPLSGGESWERVSLAPGIELHIRHPVSPAEAESIKELVDTARKLFKKRKKGG